MARLLTLMAVALFVLSSVVLAVGAQAWVWAAALLAAAVLVGLTTGVLGRAPLGSAAVARPAQESARRTSAHVGRTAGALR